MGVVCSKAVRWGKGKKKLFLPKILKIFLSKIFLQKIFSSKIFLPENFLSKLSRQKYFSKKYFLEIFFKKILCIFKKYFHQKYFLKEKFTISISKKNTNYFSKKKVGAKPPCCPQGLGWYRAIARFQPSITISLYTRHPLEADTCLCGAGIRCGWWRHGPSRVTCFTLLSLLFIINPINFYRPSPRHSKCINKTIIRWESIINEAVFLASHRSVLMDRWGNASKADRCITRRMFNVPA